MDVNKWYLKKTYIPQLGTEEFVKFAAGGFGLITKVANEAFGAGVDYKVVKSQSAYYDHENKTIGIPVWYLLPEALEELIPGATSADSITLVNGSTIHESLHFKLTKQSMTEMMAGLSMNLTHSVPFNVRNMAMNVVEDLFIESKVAPNLAGWIESKNEIFFGSKVETVIAKIDTSIPETLVDAILVTKLIASRSAIYAALPTNIVAILQSIETAKVINRPLVAAQLLNAIYDLAKDSEEESPSESDEQADPSASETDRDGDSSEESGESEGSESSETGESSETDSENGETSETGETGSENGETSESSENGETTAESTMTGSTSSDDLDPSEGIYSSKEINETLKKILEENDDEIKAIVNEFEKEISEMIEGTREEKTIEIKTSVIESLKKRLVTRNISEYPESSDTGFVPEMTDRFAHQLKQLRTVAKAEGIAKKTGSRVDPLRLHNAAIDGKIFSRKSAVETGRSDDIEIIILVDASGSMNSGRHISTGYVSLYKQVLGVTQKLYSALRNSNVTTKVFAHTSDFADDCLVVKIADPTTRNYKSAFNKALSIDLSENLDGIAIEHVCKEFSSDSRKKRILIVLSDGAPLSPNYNGRWATIHTISEIEKARKNGIDVYSISLIEHVVKTNDSIYGSDFNINATAGIDNALTNMVTKLVRRK